MNRLRGILLTLSVSFAVVPQSQAFDWEEFMPRWVAVRNAFQTTPLVNLLSYKVPHNRGVSLGPQNYLSADPANPATVYRIHPETWEVFQSTDFGATWHIQSSLPTKLAGSTREPNWEFSPILFGPVIKNHSTLLVQTPEIGAFTHYLMSSDQGKTWTAPFEKVQVIERDEEFTFTRVLAFTQGKWVAVKSKYGPMREDRYFESTDGREWVSSILKDPLITHPCVSVADSVAESARQWADQKGVWPGKNPGTVQIDGAQSPKENLVYVLLSKGIVPGWIDQTAEGRILIQSGDGGKSWKQLLQSTDESQEFDNGRCLYFHAICGSDKLLMSDSRHLYASTDGGATRKTVFDLNSLKKTLQLKPDSPPPGIESFVVSDTHPDTLYIRLEYLFITDRE